MLKRARDKLIDQHRIDELNTLLIYERIAIWLQSSIICFHLGPNKWIFRCVIAIEESHVIT